MDILTKSPRTRRRILCFLYKIEGLFLKIKQTTPNMNIIIAKLELPCDLKNEIYKYCYIVSKFVSIITYQTHFYSCKDIQLQSANAMAFQIIQS